MDENAPGLEVGFLIDTGSSYDALIQMAKLMDSTEGQVLQNAASIERATSGMVNLGPATASVRSFGAAATREYQSIARERATAEKAGEAFIRQVQRETAVFGLNRSEMRAVKAETLALAAEKRGLAELAGRIRAEDAALAGKELTAARQARFEAQAAAEDRQMAADMAAAAAAREAIALRAGADAAARAARQHADLAARVRGSQAAMEADAAAAERLRMSTDPLYAATSRLNAEIAESTRLYQVGATAPAEYARQQDVLVGRLRAVEQQHESVNRGFGAIGTSGKLAGHHMQNLAFQFNDIGIQMFAAAQSSEPLKMAFMALVQQGSQIGGIMSQAGVGVRAVGVAFLAMSRDILIAAATNPIILGIAAPIGAFAGVVSLLNDSARDSKEMETYARSLGLTAEEIKKLDNVTVTFGDTAKAVFQVAGRAIWDNIGPAVTSTWETMKDWLSWIGDGVRSAVNFMIGGFVGAYNVITKNWRMFPAVIGDVFYSAVNNAIGAINTLLKSAVDGINALGAQANKILPEAMQIPTLSAPQISRLSNSYAGAAAQIGKAAQAELGKTMGVDYLGKLASAVFDPIDAQRKKNARDRIRGQAEEMGFLDPEKGKSDKAAGLSDAQRAYEAAVKAAKEYAAAQLDEAKKVGLSAKQLRLYADTVAMAKAPTDALKLAIAGAAAVREKAYSAQANKDFQANVMQPLRDELALYGLVGPAREAAALELEKQAFIARNMDDGIKVATARWLEYYNLKKELIGKDAAEAAEAESIRRIREELDALINAAREAGDAIARSFGRIGGAVGDVIQVLTEYQKRQFEIEAQVKAKNLTEQQGAQATARLQIQGYTALAGAAKGFFKTGSDGYRAMAAAEKAFALVQLANTAVNVAAGAAKMFASLGPWAFPVVAAMVGVMAALGFGGGGGGSPVKQPETNRGTGTVLGDTSAQSESIKNSIDALREVDTIMLSYSRQMAASLRSIESQIGGFASLIIRDAGGITDGGGIAEGFKTSGIGSVLSKIPLIGGFLGGLFGTKTTLLGSGLSAGAQSLGGILANGFDAQTYMEVQKKKKFLGFTTSNKTSTTFSAADPTLENQFALILREFNNAIVAAAGPLGAATTEIQQRLNGFVVNIGKIDLKGLTGAEIEEKLTAVFGAAADNMARAAFPGMERFQRAGEGLFETIVRVASVAESVTAAFTLLGQAATGMSLDAKVALADQFDSISDLSNAVDSYFSAFYTREEQAAARTAQMASVFQSLNLTMPTTLAGFRQMVEAQNLNTAAGQAAYATLLQLAPAFAELQAAMSGAKSAADIATERQDLERQLLELRGDTAALRALQLAKLDASNRALQQQIWAIQDAQAAAKAADELRKAWASVGDSIMDEVRRIRGLSDAGGGNSFALLQGQFNAATDSARGGDMDAAKSLPGLSKALLDAAAAAATSRQELDRIRAQIAASLEATNGLIGAISGSPAATNAALLNAGANSQPETLAVNDNGAEAAARFEDLRAETAQLRSDLTAALATIAANTGRVAKKMDDVTSQSGGDAIATVSAAA